MKRFLTIAFLGLAAIGLAACGGSDGPVNDNGGGDDDGKVEEEQTQLTPLALVRALNAAVAELEKVSAVTGDDSALAEAIKAEDKAKSLAETQGVSATARMAAIEARGYLAELQGARKAVADALAAAGSHATDAERKEAEDALKAADRQLRRTASSTLMGINKAYDTDAKLDKRASDTAEDVRTAIMAASVAPTSPGNEWDKNAFARGTTRDSSTMMTFAEIFAGELVDVKFASPNAKGVLPKGISVQGEKVPASTALDATNGRMATAPSGFMGIAGTFVFVGDDAPTSAPTGEFGDGWYFHPTNPGHYYTEDAESVSLQYERAKFVDWGLWFDGSSLKGYAGVGVGSDDLNGVNPNGVNPGWADDLPDTAASSATYEGKAAGVSARRTGGKNAAPTYASGHFTADVKLEAEFGATPELEGTISNFQGDGAHVDNDWELEFSDTDDNDGWGGASFEGDPTGSWTATSYGGTNGATGKRPTGIYGGFRAQFGTGVDVGDGDAAGVFHTTQQ